MKRSLESNFGSGRSRFQPVPQKPRVDMPVSLTPTPSSLGSGQPVMKSVAPRVPVQIVWQSQINDNSAILPSPQEHISSQQTFVTARGAELRNAILTDNREVTRDILAGYGASRIAMATDVDGQNALFYAIKKQDLRVMNDLLALSDSSKLAMQVSAHGITPLCLAAQLGWVVAVQLLLKMDSAREQILITLSPTKVQEKGNALMHAASNGHERVVSVLLDSVHVAPLLEGKTMSGFDPLMLAAHRGHEAVVKILLASTYAEDLMQSSNAEGVNALAVAVYKGRAAIVQMLLDSPFATTLLQAKGKEGFNVLMIAAQNGHEAITRMLLASNYAEVLMKETNDEGANALLLSVFKNHPAVTSVLLEFGFVEQQLAVTYKGLSAIDIALHNRHHKVAEVLRRHGAFATRGNASDHSS
jgi:ankyrin repeat protein